LRYLELHRNIELYIQDSIKDPLIKVETTQKPEKNGSRRETRTCYVAPTINWQDCLSEWAGLNKAFAIHRETKEGEAVRSEWLYYTTSIDTGSEELLKIVRQHWGIESMHWILDVVFGEDDCGVFSSAGQKTLNILRKYAVGLWKQYISRLPQKTKPTLRKTMLKALLTPQTLIDAQLATEDVTMT
jgi:predicted transposase YbfD/YdcC